MPTGQVQETSTTVMSIIGVGVAIAGLAAFSQRRPKEKDYQKAQNVASHRYDSDMRLTMRYAIVTVYARR